MAPGGAGAGSGTQPFSAPVRRWFGRAFDAPTPPQRLGWPEVAAGRHTLICAPTGSGKTLAAFLWCLDELVRADASEEGLPRGIHTLYISPLKALGYDVERNLRRPLRGIRDACRELSMHPPDIHVAVRTGDTTQSQRQAMLRKPPHVLITTPESLYILLTSRRALPLLARVRYVIVDEVHAVCGNKRGVSLALSLERLLELGDESERPEPVRIGLSATVRPVEDAARFLGGYRYDTGRGLRPRPVSVVDGGRRQDPDLLVVAPVADYTQLADDSVWPEVHALLLDWIRRQRSTLVFVRMRAQAERLSRALNELAGAELASSHHGSLAGKVRHELEDRLKEGKLPALCTTGTLELGIDVGAIDLVVQTGSPGGVSTGLQRVGRAGHLLTERSRGRLVPLFREDLVECTVIAARMLRGELEAVHTPENALDVLAQHALSAAAVEPLTGEALLGVCRRAAPFRRLGREALDAVLGLLAGRYPADIARGLARKIVWERSTDLVSALPGAARLAVTSGGVIPDRGHYTLSLPDGTRLGELEEEFVFERVVGDVIAFGAGSWRIVGIDKQRVTVTRASGQKAVIPFWKGGLFGRDPELSEAIGAFRRDLYSRAARPEQAERWLRERFPVDDWAAANLTRYFHEQRQRGARVGTDRQVVLELFPDDLGDHNLLIHSVFGNRLNAPWAMALRAKLRRRLGIDPQLVSDDNGILLRIPAGEAAPPDDLLELVSPDELEELVLGELRNSAMYGTLFRQNAARFLVLGTHGVARRTPLWLQRLRAKDLQQATASVEDFPVELETVRECLQEMMDLPRLRDLLARIAGGDIRAVRQQRDTPSPVASGLLDRFIGQFMYEYDEPRAERSLRRLQLSRDLLDQVLGRDDAHELLSPRAAEELEHQWQGRSDRTRARNADELLALILRQVMLPEQALARHCTVEPGPLVEQLLGDGRAKRYRVGESDVWTLCATEDLPLVARAFSPQRITVEPAAKLEPSDARPSDNKTARQLLLARVTESLGPSSLRELGERTGLAEKPLRAAVDALVREGTLRRGTFREGADEPLYCTPLNLEQIRRRSLGHARRQVEPVPLAALQRFVLEQQGINQGTELEEALEALSLRPLPAEVLERDLLPARVAGYRPDQLDELFAGGDWLWTGHGQGRIVLWPRSASALRRAENTAEPAGAAAEVLGELRSRGASFLGDLALALPELPPTEVQRGLWDLVWTGRATNDRFATLRQALASRRSPAATGRPARASSLASPSDPARAPLNPFRSRSKRPRRPPSRAVVDGRWALIPPPEGEVDPEGLVWLLLRRYGVVARELLAPEIVTRWSEIYPVLCQLELCGELARGPFVASLGPSQFAPSESVDRLRAFRDRSDRAPGPVLLSSCDPALIAVRRGGRADQKDADLSPPRRPTTHVVLDAGEVALVLESGSGQLHLDLEAPPEAQERWIEALRALLRRGFRAVRLARCNGKPVLDSPVRPVLEQLGFEKDGAVMEIRRFG
jgi:ATP-dependent Lhr-like helicase